ncbi:ADP-dependent NAD(P)H-hydrate dehydratase [Microbacterium marinilacus]|nr:ADP/ATP-dependent (S)-NAD(P)H-hydrate dehydratase [Microbacterium marinilacus]MBY0689964.1 NAD(P)H-hydrate dehydratase [Microbacterium marinilacus]
MTAREWTARDAAGVLQVPTATSHKYSRGVVGLRTGSPAYPGAAVLTVEGAARAGAGMVRWLGEPEVARLVLHRRPETVTGEGRTDAWVLGSGVDARSRPDEVRAAMLGALRSGAPTVVDAGALDLAAEARGPIVVTPHDGELREVRIPLGLGVDDLEGEDPLQDRLRRGFDERLLVARETAVALGGVVLLKGAVTIVAAPTGWWTAVRAGTPWLATAGTGDVLAGAIGALAAAAAANGPIDADALGPVAATGAWLHGHAGRLASGVAGGEAGHPVTALDVAAHLPAAYAAALAAS